MCAGMLASMSLSGTLYVSSMMNMPASLPERPPRRKAVDQNALEGRAYNRRSAITNRKSHITNRKSRMDFIHVHRPPAEPGRPIHHLRHGTGGNEHALLPLAEML